MQGNNNVLTSLTITDAGLIDDKAGIALFWFDVPDKTWEKHRIEFFLENSDYKIQESGQKALSVLCAGAGMHEVSDASEFIGKEVSQLTLDEVCRLTRSHGRKINRPSPIPSSYQSSKARYVYVISCADTPEPICKIGIAGSPEKRLKELSTSSPHVLRIEFSRFCSAARDVEVAAHEFFADHRKNGEWFSLEPAKAISFVNDNIDRIAA